MKSYAKLHALPLGSVQAEGWIKEQLTRNKNGMGGHLDELEPTMIATPYTTRESCEVWKESMRPGWGAELSGNYWYGLIMLAYTLNDEELKAKATRWVDEMMKNLEEDGYLGSYKKTDDRMDDYNAWGVANCGMKALIAYWEATGRQDVFDAVYGCMLWFCKNWAGNKKTRYAGITSLETMSRMYELTGDQRLLDYCNEYIEFLDRNDLYDISRRAYLSPTLTYSVEHSAGYATKLWAYTGAYKAGGDRLNLKAAENGVRKMEDKALQKNGGIPNSAEYIAPRSGSVETEYCAYSFWEAAMLHLMEATGKVHYADLMEQVALNGAQGARKKDEKAIPYMSSPNQLLATSNSHYFCSQLYAPCYPTACCPVVSVWVMPNYLRSMAMEGADGLYLTTYGPATIRWNDLTVKEETMYPFRDTVTFRIEGAAHAKLHFRIPGWCKNARLAVNGKPVAAAVEEGYLVLERDWTSGDEIVLTLPMEVRISQVDDRDAGRRFPLAIEYGPLLFSYHVPEEWIVTKGKPYTPVPEGWEWWAIKAVKPWDDRGDTYEQNGLRGHVAPWYFAADSGMRPEDVTVELCDEGGYVWEDPKIKLRIPVYRALHAYAPYASKTMEPFEAPLTVYGDPYELELVPYGCTNLRITYIPRAKLPAEPMPDPRIK